MPDDQFFSASVPRGEKVRVLHITPCFYPATIWGGPIFSTKAICDEIAPRDEFVLRVLTTDTAGPKLSQKLVLPKRTQQFPAGYEVHYARRRFRNSVSPDLFRLLPDQVRWADIVHLTATYSSTTIPALLLARLLGKPLVWSPRGALQATAEWQGAPNRFAKTAFERIIRCVRPGNAVLHVTAEIERNLSLSRIPGMVTEFIPNSVPIPPMPDSPKTWRRGNKVQLMFLSRVHQKKGIEGLIDALVLLPERFELDIYGQGADSYIDDLKGRVRQLGLVDRVRFRGHVDGTDKSQAFFDADIFVLPTHSENFGIVIAEAMAHGLPTITTKGAPWSEIETRGAGYWVDNSPRDLAAAIIRLDALNLEQVGMRGRAWMAEQYSPAAMGDTFACLYRRLVRSKAA